MFVEQPPAFYRLLFPGAVWRVCRPGMRSVCLTFDDGPHPDVTPRVLDILDSFSARATFFAVGDNAARFPGLVDEIRRRGHLLGNHTMNHLQGIRCSRFAYTRNIALADAHIGSRLFRPPHGILTPAQLRAVRSRYRVVMYDVVTRDYSSRLSADDVVANVRRYTRNGSIIVFHDSLKAAPRMLDALPRALAWLRDTGYSFITLDDIL